MIDYAAYARELRHELHQCPEIGFDLEKTTAIVKRELDVLGIPYTERFGKGSVVATISEGKPFTFGLRADMDALPVQEASQNPFPSKHPGIMHACGHDGHTAQMLAVARCLNDQKEDLRCGVKIIFSPAEEYITPGCKMLAENGVMEGIDAVIACHVDPRLDLGNIGVTIGGMNANSMGIIAEFFGKPAHAQVQQKGVDAIRMGMQAYMSMELMLAKEVSPLTSCLLNVGSFHGGNTNNIICDYAKMFLSSRTQDDELTAFLERRVREICEGTAQMCGGSAKVTVTKLLPYVYNHPEMVEKFSETAEKLLGKEHIHAMERTMGGEDFSFLSRIRPGVLFRLGTRNDFNPDTAATLHNDHFDLDERCFEIGIPLFVQFVLEHQDGISFKEGICV